MKFIKTFVVIFCLIFAVLLYDKYQTFQSPWKQYYYKTLSNPIRDTALQATQLMPKGNVLELGAGSGNETIFFLKKGYKVWSIDNDKLSHEFIYSRREILDYNSELKTFCIDFVHIPWHDFPQFNIVHASYSLPFCNKKDFYSTWNNIVSQIAPGGVFSGTFFAQENQAPSKIILLSEQELRDMFKPFIIESFETIDEKMSVKKGGYKMQRCFKVIARKI